MANEIGRILQYDFHASDFCLCIFMGKLEEVTWIQTLKPSKLPISFERNLVKAKFQSSEFCCLGVMRTTPKQK
jgi:hypothetical protein